MPTEQITSEQKKNIKEYIKGEHLKCARSPQYFIRNYCWIQKTKGGRGLFSLYDYQDKVISDFESHEYTIILKARQIGISTAISAYSLWLMLFHKDAKVLVVATEEKVAKNLVAKVLFAYQQLPSWLKLPTTAENKLNIAFENGSEIFAVSSSPSATRSFSANLLVIDECAHIENFSEVWASAAATVSTGGKIIVLSTPNGMNFFNKMWESANNEEQISDFKFYPVKLDWRVHPERDDKWYQKTLNIQGAEKFKQEFETEFLSSGNLVFSGEAITWYKENYIKPPLYKTGVDNGLWVWQEPDYSRSYILSADIARGDGKDFSACHVFDAETCEQVCEYKGKIDSRQFGHMLVELGTRYNDALVIPDATGLGLDVVQTLIERQYKNLFYMTEDLKYIDAEHQYSGAFNRNEKRAKPGFTYSLRTRPLAIAKLEEYIRDHSVIVHSQRTLDEWGVFIWYHAKAQAMDGYNDDLTMALSLALWVRDTALKLHRNNAELTKSALNNFHQTSVESKILVPKGLDADPYILNFGRNTLKGNNQKEDLRWLL